MTVRMPPEALKPTAVPRGCANDNACGEPICCGTGCRNDAGCVAGGFPTQGIAGTLTNGDAALKKYGATRVVGCATHPVLSGPAVDRIEASALDELVVTDTIPLRDNALACRKIRQLSVAGLLAETMRRIRDEESVSSLYLD